MRLLHRTAALLGLALVLIVLYGTSSASAGNGKRHRNLFVGEQTVISSKNVDRFSLGAPGIVDVRVPNDGSDLVVVALAPGTTTLLLLMKNGEKVHYTISVRQVRVSKRHNIRLDFYFVEFSKDQGSRIGIGWPGTIGGNAKVNLRADLLGNSVTSATASITAQVLPRLDLAQNGGWAKVMRESSVVMANGETGSFESGAELNFRVANSVSTGIEKIKYGSRVEVQPRYDRTTKRLDIRITAVVSALTGAAVDGLPGRTFTNLNTLVNLELGQSIVLAGIHAQSSAKRSEGVPWFNRIPVFGYLFGSKTHRSSSVENLIFIVPTVIQSVDIERRNLVEVAYEAYRSNSASAHQALREWVLPAVEEQD